MRVFVKVKETVHLEKVVEVDIPDGKCLCDVESKVLDLAFAELPDYDSYNWDLVGSEGTEIEIVDGKYDQN